MRRRETGLLAALALAAFLLRAASAGYGLPHTLHYDEGRYVSQAVRIGEDGFRPASYAYGPLYSYLLAAALGGVFLAGRAFGTWGGASEFALHYFEDPSVVYATARLLSAACGAAAAALLAAAARRGFSADRGGAGGSGGGGGDAAARWTAPLALAVFPAAVAMGAEARAESLQLALLAGWLLFSAAHARSGKPRSALGAGLLLGLASAAKMNALFFLPWQLALPLLGAGRRRPAAWAAALLAPAAGFLLGAPIALIDLPAVAHALRFNAVVSASDAPFDAGAATISAARFVAGWPHEGVGPFLGLLALVGAFLGVIRRDARLLWLATAGWGFIAWNLVANPSTLVARYLLPAAPMLFLLAGEGLGFAASRLAAVTRAGRGAFAAVLLVLAVVPAAWASARMLAVNQREDTRLAAKRWIEANLAGGTAVLLEDPIGSVPLSPDAASIAGDPRGTRRAAALERAPGPHYRLHWLPVPWGMASAAEASRLAAEGVTLPGFDAEARARLSLAPWRADGVTIAVASSAVFDRHFRGGPDALPEYRAFYEELFREGRLLHVEEPGTGGRPGPRVLVYAITR